MLVQHALVPDQLETAALDQFAWLLRAAASRGPEMTPVLFQVLANGLDNKLREDLERLKKIRAHRGLRHFWG